MNRLGKILTLGLERKRAWQLPVIAGLLVLFAGGIWWYANWLGAGCFDVWKLIEQDNTEDLAYVLRWRPGKTNAKSANGWTPLHWAAYLGGHTEVVKMLLEAGVKVNTKTKSGLEADQTPLDFAIANGQKTVIDLLCKHGAKS